MSSLIRPALVLGDINADMSMAIPFYPAEGGECTARGLRWGSGGAGVNVATALSLLGAEALLAGRVGDDAAGSAALRAARQAGVDLGLVQHDPLHATGVVCAAVSPTGERTFFSFRGANAALDSTPDAALVARCAIMHLSSYPLLEDPQRSTALAFVAAARAAGVPLSLDLAPPPITRCAALIHDLLPDLALLFLNQQELAALLPGHHEQAALDLLLDQGVPLIALKRGPSGCSVLTRQQRVDLTALAVGACDSTACGDAFAAGLLWGFMHGADLATCAALGNLLGGLTAAAYGSADALPTRAQAHKAAAEASAAYDTAAALLA